MGTYRKRYDIYMDGALIESSVTIEKVAELSKLSVNTCKVYTRNMIKGDSVDVRGLSVVCATHGESKSIRNSQETDKLKEEWDKVTAQLRTVFN